MKKFSFLTNCVLFGALLNNALACTTILVPNEASKDGSWLVARSADSKADKAQVFLIHPRVENQKGIYSTKAHQGMNDFTYPLPTKSFQYSTIANWQSTLHGATGFNEMGVGISATESIYAKDELLKFDPYNEKNGISEDDILDVLLPRIKSAKEGVLLLGDIIEKQGAAEGFGVAFVDSKEIWYLESATAHQWMAAKIPNNSYFVSANQGRLKQLKFNDENTLHSKNLINFAIIHKAYNPKVDKDFDFFKVYTRNDDRDLTYNYPRVWWIQKMFNPSLNQDVKNGANFNVFLQPEQKLSVDDLKKALRSHYDGTKYDPYANFNENENIYRVVSVFRTYESHIMQVRPWLPKEIGRLNYVAIGMADLSVYLPYYFGNDEFIAGYQQGTNEADDKSIYWIYRKLQTLVMSDYNKYAPIVKNAYAKFEKDTSLKQEVMEKEYLNLYKKDKNKAKQILVDFSLQNQMEAKKLTQDLTNQIFTLLTRDMDIKYKSLNKNKKD
ncbi:C69 family dipeptidase [Campylobacter lari]|uniref:C69 family dipeptidase n=1 Tax=Campylobacter lari TaxID=201 RepID=UPI0021C1DF4A|nr:C69 family dipeptidase [Campylobacter lari]